MKTTCLLVTLCIFILCCCTNKLTFRNTQPPSISINSDYSLHPNLIDGPAQAKRFNRALLTIVDSISKDAHFQLLMDNSYKSNYIMSLIFGKTEINSTEFSGNSFTAYLKDSYSNELIEDFGCDAFSPSNYYCFAYNPEMKDSTNFSDLSKNISFGSKLRYFIPIQEVLIPVNRTSGKVFALNKFIGGGGSALRDVNINLTHLLNNIFVFNQPDYPRKIFKRGSNYIYHNNYLYKERKKADFVISARVFDDKNGNVRLIFYFAGKDVNLVAPEPLNTQIILNKQRMVTGDYTEAMLKIYPVIREFILMNTLFDEKKITHN